MTYVLMIWKSEIINLKSEIKTESLTRNKKFIKRWNNE